MIVKNDSDKEELLIIGKIVADCMKYMAAQLKPGITTLELDQIAENFLEANGARSAPKVMYNFPGFTCISVNEEVAHGIPGSRIIKEGDLVNIDVSAEKNGYFADTGGSFPVGKVNHKQQLVCDATKEALNSAIKVAKAGNKINLIGKAVEEVAEKYGLTIIKNLYSHGVGRALHEAPELIPTYFNNADNRILTKGLVMTIEPFLTTGVAHAFHGNDKWTLLNKLGTYTAQYEHSMIITDDEPIILTQ